MGVDVAVCTVVLLPFSAVIVVPFVSATVGVGSWCFVVVVLDGCVEVTGLVISVVVEIVFGVVVTIGMVVSMG